MTSFIMQIIVMVILFVVSVIVIVVSGILAFIYKYLMNGSKKTINVNNVIKPDTTGYKIFKKSDGEVLAVCGKNVTIGDIKKTARHIGYKNFKVYVKGEKKKLVFPIERDVYIEYNIGV